MIPITREPLSPKQILDYVGRPDPVILEIGCNDGEHTRMFMELFPEARIFCFEPDPRAQERFYESQFFKALKTLDKPRVELVPMAVGNHDGTAKFYPSDGLPNPLPPDEFARIAAKLPKGWDLSGSLRAPKLHLRHHPWCKFTEPIKVPVIKLDSWAKGYGIDRVDFIWADVQGAEIDVIQGGLKTLANTRYFYTEYSQHELYGGQINLDQILALLPDFEAVTLYSEDVLLRHR